MAEKETNFRFWGNWLRSIEWMGSDAEKGAFLLKITRYALTGEEPEITPSEGMAWELIKTAIDADSASKSNGASGGRGRSKQKPAKTNGEPERRQCSEQNAECAKPLSENAETPLSDFGNPPFANDETPSFYESETETEDETETETEGGMSVRAGARCGGSAYPLECLEAFNRSMGSCYGQLPPKVAGFLALHADEFREKWPPGSVAEMVAFKRAEWEGDGRMRRNLTPNTLLGPEHFEQYMHQAKQAKEDEKEESDGGRFSEYRPRSI